MKITKSELKKIIREELGLVSEDFRALPGWRNRKEGLSDLEFVIDQLSNSMEHFSEKEFVDHLSKATKYNASSLKKVFNAYWDLGAMDRFKIGVDLNKTKKFLAKLGIK